MRRRSVGSDSTHQRLTLDLRCAALAALLSCVSCTTLSTGPPPKESPIVVSGAAGVLSKADSEAAVDRAVANAPEPDAMHDLIALTESLDVGPLYKDNAVGLLVDGPQTYSAMLESVRAARHEIDVEMYIIGDDPIGQKFADALAKKAADGVAVRVLYDSIGSWEATGHFFEDMRNSGIDVRSYNPPNPLTGGNPLKINNRDHRKLLIVDDVVAFTGGMNINRKYSSASSGGSGKSGGSGSSGARASQNSGWRDTDIVVRGPAVVGFGRIFRENWQRAGGTIDDPPDPPPKKAGHDLVSILASLGGDNTVSSIRVAYELAIDKATRRVWITQPYFGPDPALIEALKNAVARGVDVQIILPSRSDSAIVLANSRYYYTKLLDAGVRVYESNDTMMHAKTAVIDGIWATVGSSNLDYRSFLHNDEVNAVVIGTGFGAQMEKQFGIDRDASREITADAWRKRSWFGRAKEYASHAFAYWL
jgi:cardiolipin synthase